MTNTNSCNSNSDSINKKYNTFSENKESNMASKSYIYILDWTQSHNAIKIGKANDIQARYYQLKQHYGKADLDNSYWIEVPVSKVTNIETLIHLRLNQYKKNPSIQADGSTEFFEKSAINSLKELCEDMGLTIHKGIKKKPKKIKRKEVDYVYLQQKKKERLEQEIRKNQRTLRRIVTVLKYLNSQANRFIPRYEKPNDNQIIKYYNSTSNVKRYVNSVILCPENKIKTDYLVWLIHKSRLAMSYENGNSSSMSLIINCDYHYNIKSQNLISIYFDKSFLIPFKELRDIKKSEYPAEYNYIQEHLITHINEIIRLTEQYLNKMTANFDVNSWLNPVFEWQNEKQATSKAGEFKFLKLSQREIKIKLEIDKIKSITKGKNTWEIKLNDEKSTILSISQNLLNNDSNNDSLNNQTLYPYDENNYFKFLKFIEDLFIKDNIYSSYSDQIIFYPKKILKKSYTLDDLSDIF